MWAYRILIAGLVASLIVVLFFIFAVIFNPRNPDPSDLASCFKVSIPSDVQVVEKDVEAPDHTNIYFQINNCSESFYHLLLAHSYATGFSQEDQRRKAIDDFTFYHLDVPPEGPRACEANYVGVASYGAAILYSPRDKQAVIFVDTY